MSRPSLPQAVVGADLEAVSQAAAEAFVRVATEAARRAGRFTVALPGGRTPRRLFQLLATTHRDDVPWAQTHVFFGDERCVPPWEPESNYRLADESLLTLVPVPAEQVHRIEGELGAGVAAARYDAELRGFFDAEGGADSPGVDTFDLALQGVGADGHTASLFPGAPALQEREKWAVPVAAPEGVAPFVERVTLTLPVLQGARQVFLLAVGSDKRGVVGRILDADIAAGRGLPFPAGWVRGTEATVWFVDEGARGGG